MWFSYQGTGALANGGGSRIKGRELLLMGVVLVSRDVRLANGGGSRIKGRETCLSKSGQGAIPILWIA